MIDATIFDVGKQPQVFVDNWLLEQSDGVTRRWHKPQRIASEPVLKADQPWEATPYLTYSTYNVLQDPADGLVKCWYEDLGPMLPYQPHPWKNRMLYAVSKDGLTFDKPALGKVRVDGRPTNIFAGYVEGATPGSENLWANVGVHSPGVVIDPYSTDERYRMLFSRATQDGRHQIECAHSADGITWTPYEQRPRFGNGSNLSDVSTITFDPVTRLFLQYTRHDRMNNAGPPEIWPGVPSGPGGCFQSYYPHRPDLMNKRRVFRTVSADFLNWADLTLLSTPDDECDNLDVGHYGVGQFQIGTMYFGTLGILHYVDNEMDVRLIYSRDGLNWRATDNGRSFLAPRGGACWDRHMVSIVSPPIRFGDQWYFYHGGSWSHHDFWWAGEQHLDHPEAADPASNVRFGIGVAALRFEGIASLDAVHPRRGRIVTRPITTDGKSLAINARCRNGGQIRVAMADANGTILPGRSFDDCIPFHGDEVRHLVRWTSGAVPDPSASTGRYRKLMIQLDEAEVFGFIFQE